MQNFIYALIQVLHNFGAVLIIGTAASVLWLVRDDIRLGRKLSLLSIVAWVLQAMTGLMFGLATYSFEHHLPDIHGIAVGALIIKMACVAGGIVLSFAYLKLGAGWSRARQLIAGRIMLALGTVALGSAAFLRWFS